jgi:hypothetical protein
VEKARAVAAVVVVLQVPLQLLPAARGVLVVPGQTTPTQQTLVVAVRLVLAVRLVAPERML